MPTKTARPAVGDAYLKLIRAFPLRPLRSDADLDAAVAMVDALTDQEGLSPDAHDYLDVLARLIADYEDEHDPLPEMSGIEALRYLIEENGLSRSQLSRETGIAVTTLSEVLSGKRGISPKLRGRLAAYFSVDVALFV